MGTANIPAATDGTPIPAAHHNSLRDAELVHKVPRNSSGNATDLAGSMGTSIYRWLMGYFQGLTIGVAANLVRIAESSGVLQFYFSGSNTLGATISVNGINAQYIEPGTLNFLAFADLEAPILRYYEYTADDTLTLPSWVLGIMYELCGGGGGGGGGSGAGNITFYGPTPGSGGGGASGAPVESGVQKVTGGITLTISVGDGGAPGAGGTNKNAGAQGRMLISMLLPGSEAVEAVRLELLRSIISWMVLTGRIRNIIQAERLRADRLAGAAVRVAGAEVIARRMGNRAAAAAADWADV